MKRQVMGIEELYGPKQNLVLMDNNVLASTRFDIIVNDILDLGFYRGAKLNRKLRKVDFNQGTDANYLTLRNMALLAKLPIDPLRIAFDHISMKDVYVSKIKLARDHGILDLSNYVLYNYLDTPEDFYERLRINCQLNTDLGTKIYSFPMKYIPLDAKDRSFVGKNWNKKLLRGVQCILLVTRGLVTTRLEFFGAAFGHSAEEFETIAIMPERYIIHRRKYENNGAGDCEKTYKALGPNQKRMLAEALVDWPTASRIMKKTRSLRIRKLLSHFMNAKGSIVKE